MVKVKRAIQVHVEGRSLGGGGGEGRVNEVAMVDWPMRYSKGGGKDGDKGGTGGGGGG